MRRRFTAHPLVDVLAELMIRHGVPDNIRSDQGLDFVAKAVRENGGDKLVHGSGGISQLRAE